VGFSAQKGPVVGKKKGKFVTFKVRKETRMVQELNSHTLLRGTIKSLSDWGHGYFPNGKKLEGRYKWKGTSLQEIRRAR